MGERRFRSTIGLFAVLSFCLVFLCLSAWAVDTGEPPPPATTTTNSLLPSTAKTALAFVPKGWFIESSAEGDLNKDGLRDHAFVIARSEHGGEAKTAGQRKLVIALREADGLLHKSAESESAVSPQGEPPQLTIKKDVLVVAHSDSQKEGPKTTYKYQLRNGQWDLIGYTEVDYDSSAGHPAGSLDVNLLTGEVIGSANQNHLSSRRFLEVRSPAIEGSESCAADWTAPAAWLNSKSQECPIVAVLSVHNKNTLFLRVELEGSNNISEEDVALINAKGAVIPALSKKKTTYGYILAGYDLKSLELQDGIAPNADVRAEEHRGDGPELLRLTVKVTPVHCGCKKTFSTAQNDDAGGILLTKLKGLPTLAEIDVRESASVHPRLRPPTEDE